MNFTEIALNRQSCRSFDETRPVEEEKLLRLANTWEVRHGGFSGRVAQQFIQYLQGNQ